MASQNPMVFCIFSDKIRYLTMTDSTKVWMPDTFFRNEKIGRFHNILQPNLYVRVFPNGDVLYSIRVSLTCACSMHLALFPLDMQTCNLDVASCEYTYLIYIIRIRQKKLLKNLSANISGTVFPNVDVLYSLRVSLTCACSMHLALFPLDMQTCNLDVASCEYTYLIYIIKIGQKKLLDNKQISYAV